MKFICLVLTLAVTLSKSKNFLVETDRKLPNHLKTEDVNGNHFLKKGQKSKYFLTFFDLDIFLPFLRK